MDNRMLAETELEGLALLIADMGMAPATVEVLHARTVAGMICPTCSRRGRCPTSAEVHQRAKKKADGFHKDTDLVGLLVQNGWKMPEALAKIAGEKAPQPGQRSDFPPADALAKILSVIAEGRSQDEGRIISVLELLDLN